MPATRPVALNWYARYYSSCCRVSFGDVLGLIPVRRPQAQRRDDGFAIEVRRQNVAAIDDQAARDPGSFSILVGPEQLAQVLRIHADLGAVSGALVRRRNLRSRNPGLIVRVHIRVPALGRHLARWHLKVSAVNGVQVQGSVIVNEVLHRAHTLVKHRLDIGIQWKGRHTGAFNRLCG